MRIFSSFDTNFKKEALSNYQNIHGQEKVHLLEKSHFFFVKHILFPFFAIILSALFAGYIASTYLEANTTITSIIIIATLILGIMYAALFKHYIDYKMDYCIITPDEIILTEQSGLFNRGIRTLDAAKVKSISIQKKSILHSLFNNGDIVFMSDGDDILGEIILNYIHNPEGQKAILHNIILKE